MPTRRDPAPSAWLSGLVLGAGLAYARASRRRCLEDRLDPAAIYDAPLIGEIPAPSAGRYRSNWTAAADPLPMAADPQSPLAEAFRFTAGSVERIRAAHGNQLVVAFVSTGTGPARVPSWPIWPLPSLRVARRCSRSTPTPPGAVSRRFSCRAVLEVGLRAGTRRPPVRFRLYSAQPAQPASHRPRLRSHSCGEDNWRGVLKSDGGDVGEAKASFDLVLIDSPALLRVAEATELVDESDAAIIVVGSDESVRDHITMVEKLT